MKTLKIAALVLALMLTLCAAHAETTYYATSQGVYYHTVADCSGMQNASPIDEEGALLSGKLPCPECVEPETTYYATPKGVYYHTVIDCSGMQYASPIGEDVALDSGKLPCPVCNVRYVAPSPTTRQAYHNRAAAVDAADACGIMRV